MKTLNKILMLVLIGFLAFSCNRKIEEVEPTKLNKEIPSFWGNRPHRGPYTWRESTYTSRWEKEKTVSMRNASDMRVALYQIKVSSLQGNNEDMSYNTSRIDFYVKYKGSSSYTFITSHKPIYSDPNYPNLKSVTFSNFSNVKNIEAVKFIFRNLYQVKCSIWRD